MKPVLTHLAETALYVDDLARAIAFYQSLFHLPILRQDDRFAVLRVTDNQVLLLFRRGASLKPTVLPGGAIPGHDGNGPLHVCFGITTDAVPEWKTLLADRGISLEGEMLWPSGARSLYFRDPDGHAVELATPGVFS